MNTTWLINDQDAPRAIKCASCGRKHELESGDSVCSCGQLYNAFGQRLADPSQWDESEDY